MGVVKIGEIIQSSTAEFIAQSYELHQPPPLGSLVKTNLPLEIYGIVYNATTASIEPGRRPLARGGECEEDLYHANPQLAKLLRTEFNTLVVGYREGDCYHHYLPPQPARIHSFVYVCEAEEVKEFSQSLDLLPLLLSAQLPVSTEEVVSAFLRQASRVHPDPHSFLVKAGKELALLLSGEMNRLNTILRRIKG